tara:strand:- start:14524 stop:15378 length:855 start_codon:yes stop_codon:yes gene_type:complete
MSIKHSKLRNTGLIFELLVKQVAADILNNRDSKAVNIIKKHFTGNSMLVKEFKLYEFISNNKGISKNKASAILSTITEVSRRLDRKSINKQKYHLISDIKESYNVDDFFSVPIRDYKQFAALYCLLEAQSSDNVVEPEFLINNRTTILEHLTSTKHDEENVKDELIEEYSKYDKDLRLLTFKILLEKFNKNYSNLLPEQKLLLKEFITSSNSTTKLRKIVNTQITNIKEEISALASKVKDDVVKIKLQEVLKNIKLIPNSQKIKDSNLVDLMLYYDLVKELKSL